MNSNGDFINTEAKWNWQPADLKLQQKKALQVWWATIFNKEVIKGAALFEKLIPFPDQLWSFIQTCGIISIFLTGSLFRLHH